VVWLAVRGATVAASWPGCAVLCCAALGTVVLQQCGACCVSCTIQVVLKLWAALLQGLAVRAAVMPRGCAALPGQPCCMAAVVAWVLRVRLAMSVLAMCHV
jgi:hypothetical protein